MTAKKSAKRPRLADSIIAGLEDAIADAKGEPGRVVHHVPEQIDVKAIRKALKLSQAEFATAYCLSLRSVQNWESHHRLPDLTARVLLTVIAKEPEAVRRALSAA